jgi:hypothetical protein
MTAVRKIRLLNGPKQNYMHLRKKIIHFLKLSGYSTNELYKYGI